MLTRFGLLIYINPVPTRIFYEKIHKIFRNHIEASGRVLLAKYESKNKMEKNKRKSQRIHNTKKAMNKSIRKHKASATQYLYGTESCRTDDFRNKVIKEARLFRDNLKFCSCSYCCNPRKIYKGKDALTLNEKKQHAYLNVESSGAQTFSN